MQDNENMSISERRRKVTLEKLDDAGLETLGLELGKKLGEITKEAQEKAELLAKPFGIKVVVAIQFRDPETDEIIY